MLRVLCAAKGKQRVMRAEDTSNEVELHQYSISVGSME